MGDSPPSGLDYDGLAGPYAAYRRPDEAVVDALRTGANLQPATRVLEIGCGTGDHLAALRSATGCAGAGVDPSGEMLAVARERHRAITFVRGRAERLPFVDGGFDFAFSVDVVHHLDDLAAACAESFRILAGGGRVCVVTDDEETIRSRVHSEYFPESVAVEHERYPSVGEVRKSLARAGFVDIAEQRTALPYAVEDARPYAQRAFSSLHLIGEDAHRAGLSRLERDLQRAPVAAVSRKVLVWATKPHE
jgi:ubiquinone/menaquinone biosynthesis C-methylase UbiE